MNTKTMDSITSYEIGMRIGDYMKSHGIKATFLTECIGLHPASMSLLVNGKRNINVVEYAKICEALEVGLDEFIPEFRKGDE